MAEHHPLRTRDQEPKTKSFAKLNSEAELRAKQCPSAKMPSLRHLHMSDYNTVYEPSDDTYLLIDALGMEMDRVLAPAEPDGIRIRTTLEIGCGTGVPTVYTGMRLCEAEKERPGDGFIQYVTDINPDAIRVAASTSEANGISPDSFCAVQCDLASDLLPRLEGKVDVLIFNPPYVPTPEEEVGGTGIEASWAGGKNGRVVLDRALPQIAKLLARPHGAAYVITVDDNYPEEIAQIMERDHGVRVVPLLRRRARNEYLAVLKMTPMLSVQGGSP